MLRTNCKKVKEFVKAYIWYHADNELTYDKVYPTYKNYPEFAHDILVQFRKENFSNVYAYKYYKTEQNAFYEWLRDLPPSLSLDYLYRTSAVKLVGDMLEETEEERNKYTETEAEDLMNYLIYRELCAEERKYFNATAK